MMIINLIFSSILFFVWVILFDMFNVFVRSKCLETTVCYVAVENSGISIMLAGVPTHVFGQTEGAPANLTLMGFLLGMG